jgi:SAM-dependent methyltransferase
MSSQPAPYFCPVCERNLESFLPHGNPPKPQRRCPICKSNRRNRMTWLFLKRFTNLFAGTPKRFLHFAPELRLERRIRDIPNLDYLSADLNGDRAMVAVDIRDIPYPASSFDVIYCSHLLEHVPEDRTAMREMHRVLRSGGWALVVVPIRGDHTLEDPTVTTPEQRTLLFGQANHVRLYGRDIADRLRHAGFQVSVYSSRQIAGEEGVERFGLTVGDSGVVFFCEKV